MMRNPLRSRAVAIGAFHGAAMLAAVSAQAQDAPTLWSVKGVAADDVLNVRELPNGDSLKVGGIPPSARGIKGLGCMVVEPSFDRWSKMTPEEKRDAKLEWCRVDYNGMQGWVAGRFLEKQAQ